VEEEGGGWASPPYIYIYIYRERERERERERGETLWKSLKEGDDMCLEERRNQFYLFFYFFMDSVESYVQ